jgi:hypothetical protein
MARFLRQGVMGVALGLMLFSISCEKHPLGQMPEVQREQADPAKVWSEKGEKESEEAASSPTPAEGVPHEAR